MLTQAAWKHVQLDTPCGFLVPGRPCEQFHCGKCKAHFEAQDSALTWEPPTLEIGSIALAEAAFPRLRAPNMEPCFLRASEEDCLGWRQQSSRTACSTLCFVQCDTWYNVRMALKWAPCRAATATAATVLQSRYKGSSGAHVRCRDKAVTRFWSALLVFSPFSRPGIARIARLMQSPTPSPGFSSALVLKMLMPARARNSRSSARRELHMAVHKFPPHTGLMPVFGFSTTMIRFSIFDVELRQPFDPWVVESLYLVLDPEA